MPRSRTLLFAQAILATCLALAACGDDDAPSRDAAVIEIDLGADAGIDRAGSCVVVCQYYGPGEYRSECRATGGVTACEVSAYPICDTDALPVDFDGGVYPAPMCLRLDASEARVPACAVDGDGLPLLTEAPVVHCVAVE